MGPIVECFAPLAHAYPKLFLRFLRDMPLEEESQLLGEDESEMDVTRMHVRRTPPPRPSA